MMIGSRRGMWCCIIHNSWHFQFMVTGTQAHACKFNPKREVTKADQTTNQGLDIRHCRWHQCSPVFWLFYTNALVLTEM